MCSISSCDDTLPLLEALWLHTRIPHKSPYIYIYIYIHIYNSTHAYSTQMRPLVRPFVWRAIVWCVYICMYIHTYMYTHTCTYTHMYVYMCMYTYIHVHIYTQIHIQPLVRRAIVYCYIAVARSALAAHEDSAQEPYSTHAYSTQMRPLIRLLCDMQSCDDA